ncbi:16S rRNA (guanine(527)-N(7))-methyltransferase RsmG [Aliiroseovarius sp.]|uniref:16S rRNA (guanine(527)-N(7))-methyltransferase RsmG n=1 Tax=Aliiroseovarius sp. TaxID=1872442 RepID=UPI0026393E20|nr:16S rRNA (guanine(527)-N(7))-methyltransferase RsmG [Aliiroseovarius sp.]
MSDERAGFLTQVDVSRETLARLDGYAGLLTKWNPAINLVAPSTLGQLWTRHFLDSAQVLEIAPEGRTWVDIGTGGGFPGLIVAILAAEKRPDLRVTCIESDLRKATFLRTVAREIGVKADVISKRIEQVDPLGADILSARALAPLAQLLSYAERHLSPNGRALFLKGANHAAEMQEALEKWTFRADTYPSKTSSEAVILSLGDIRRA